MTAPSMARPDPVTALAIRARNVTRALQKSRPQPLQLISVVNGKSLKLHRDNLEDVISQVPPGMPVSIISVVGAFRSGKSFLLSWFVRVLSGKSTTQGRIGGGRGANNGFSWTAGTKGHTKGMTLWSEPFIREVDSGKGGRAKMAVLLVDTQGIFDHEMELHLEACLFGLSTTLSSCQIFNVKNQVQVDTLSSLAVYLELGTLADDDESGGEQDAEAPADDQSGGEQEYSAPFQRLEILIRDWQNWKEWDDPVKQNLEILHEEFSCYLEDIFPSNSANNENNEQEKIKGCFRDRIGCFGSPHPGNNVTWSGFDGTVNQIDPGFSRMVTYYIEKVILGKLKQARLPHKEEGKFAKAVEEWVELFDNGLTNGRLPSASSWLGKIFESDNNEMIDAVFGEFERTVQERSAAYVNQVELNDLLAQLKHDAMRSLKLKLKGSKNIKKEAEQHLRNKLDGKIGRAQRFNRNRATALTVFAEVLVELGRFCIGRGSRSNLRFLFRSK